MQYYHVNTVKERVARVSCTQRHIHSDNNGYSESNDVSDSAKGAGAVGQSDWQARQNAEVKSTVNKNHQLAFRLKFNKQMPLGACLVVNTHNMGGRLAETVKNAWWLKSSQEAGDGLESVIEFQV